jgi:hypothetical protein
MVAELDAQFGEDESTRTQLECHEDIVEIWFWSVLDIIIAQVRHFTYVG